VRFHAVVIGAGGGQHHFIVHQQVNAGFALVRTAAHQETDIVAFNDK